MKRLLSLAAEYWYLAAIAALMVLVLAQRAQVSDARTQAAQAREALANDRTTYAQAAKTQADEQRAIERTRQEDNERIRREANEQTAAADAAARAADASADQLRGRVAALVAASRRTGQNPNAAGRGPGQQDSAALDLLADVFGRTDGAAGIIAAYADKLDSAGSACERRADALTTVRQ